MSMRLPKKATLGDLIAAVTDEVSPVTGGSAKTNILVSYYCEGSLRYAAGAIEKADTSKNRIGGRRPIMKAMGFLLLSGLLLTSACSTQSRTVKTESYETTQDNSTAGANGAMVKKSETTETEKSSTQSGGVISGTVDIVGKTLALPFRAVGGLIDLVF